MRVALVDMAVADGFEICDFSGFASNGAFEPNYGNLLIVTDDPLAEADIFGEGGAVDTLQLYANAKIGSYKVDFVLEASYGEILIECDGHDWHDRTKQQAAYDRARDRWFLQNGLQTLRFTGSEIVHSPEKCANEVLSCLRVISATAFALAQSRSWLRGEVLLRKVLKQEALFRSSVTEAA